MSAAIDVSTVPGISAATAGALRALGLPLGTDLLRANRKALASALTGVSLDQIRAWQAYCRFLEVPGMDADRAGRLQAAGIDSLPELVGKTLAQLRGVLSGASPPPDDEALLALLLAAQQLHLTDVINGTVIDSAARPLPGTVVRGGGKSVTSDASGRFRLVGLTPGRSVTLTLTHPAKAERLVNGVTPAPSSALKGRRFRLTGQPVPAPLRLSALRGDTLPPLSSAPVTTEAQTTPPSDDDVLVVVDFYANGDARASSLFLDFAAGRFVVRTYRLAEASLPAGTQPLDRLKPTVGSLAKTTASNRKVAQMARLRGVKAKLAALPPGPARVDLAAQLVLQALADPN